MILITSAAYVNSEFQIEFGRLPPAFLPVGNKRLFEHQISALRRTFGDESIYLTLPDTYRLAEKDLVYLQRNNIHTIYSSEKLSLASSLQHAMQFLGQIDSPVRLLHGDTLVSDIPASLDIIGVVHTTEDYAWEVEEADSVAESVWCGYFCFSDAVLLTEVLLAEPEHFTKAVRNYSERKSLARLEVGGWLDFGHVNTYFHSRAQLTTERAFNTLKISEGCVVKSGTPAKKIAAEADWFGGLPAELKIFAPQFISRSSEGGKSAYVLEYLPIPPLNEVFVHGRNPVFYWDKVFEKCIGFVRECAKHELEPNERIRAQDDFFELASTKTWQRLEQFGSASAGIRIGNSNLINGTQVPCVADIVENCIKRVVSTPALPGLVHGDLCLSNILFDTRSDRIKVIDPRGLDSKGEATNLGDQRYDIAKLAHSIIGLYDHIVAGAYELSMNIGDSVNTFELSVHVDERIRAIQDDFMDKIFVQNVSARTMMPMVVLLFVSMLPLHADRLDRQQAFFANALRLYSILDK